MGLVCLGYLRVGSASVVLNEFANLVGGKIPYDFGRFFNGRGV